MHVTEERVGDGVSRYRMPNGDACWYWWDPHIYCTKPPEDHKSGVCYPRCPGKIAGASTIAKHDGSSPDGLLGHYERTACAGVALVASGTAETDWLATGETVLQRLNEAELTAGHDMRRKGDVGTAAHNVLQHLSEHDEVPPLTGGHEFAVADWWHKTRPEPRYVETVVYDSQHGVAGRFDLMFGEATPTLLDLKTGSIRAAAAIQLQIYRIACRTAGLVVPERLVILDTSDDGSWREIEVPINEGWATAALATYQNGKLINRELTKAKKAARTGSQAVAA